MMFSVEKFNSIMKITLLIAGCLANTPAMAERATLINHLQGSKGFVLEVEQNCPKKNWLKLKDKYDLDKSTRLDERIGVVGPYGVSAFHYTLSQSANGYSALFIGHTTGSRTYCLSIVILDSHRVIPRVTSAIPTGDYEARFTKEQLRAVSRLWEKCLRLGDEARRIFGYGNYLLVDGGAGGEVTWLEDVFSCESAVPNNLSAVDIQIGNVEFRLTAVYNIVYLEEIAK